MRSFVLFWDTIVASMTKLRNRFNHRRRRKNLTHCQEHCAKQVIRILKPVYKQGDSESCN